VREIIAEQLVSAVTMTGIAAACLNDAHHLGRLAGLGRHLASPPHNITVIGFCNYMGAGARLAPPGGSRATLCTNPILIAVPIAGASPFNLDMSTTVVAEGRVNVALGANGIVPSGWLIDADSKAVTDAAALYATPPSATIAPLGYPISPHKGFGLALAVELLVGAIAGASNVATPGLAGNAGLFIAFKNSFFPKGDEIPNIARAIVEKAVPEGGRWPGKAHTALVRTNLTFPKSFLDTLNTLSNAAEAKHDS
jgi:LDH2 family malate/lactate/ureidoglycolate dehydrogenase